MRLDQDRPYEAEIRQLSKRCWWVTYTHGLIRVDGGNHVWGSYERAERKTLRKLARLQAKDHRWNASLRKVRTPGCP